MTMVDEYLDRERLYTHREMTDAERPKVLRESWEILPNDDVDVPFRPARNPCQRRLKWSPSPADVDLWPVLTRREQEEEKASEFLYWVDRPGSKWVFVVSSSAKVPLDKYGEVAQKIRSAVDDLKLGGKIGVSVEPQTVLETYRAVVEHVEGNTASVCLYDPGANIPRMTIDIPKEDFIANDVPFQVGVVFEFAVWQTGRSETFVMRHIPIRHLTPKEIQAEEARFRAAFDGE